MRATVVLSAVVLLSLVSVSGFAAYPLATDDAETVKGLGSYGFVVEMPVKKFDIVGEVQGQEGGAGNGLVGSRYHLLDSFFVAGGFSKDFQTTANKVTAGFHFEF